MEIRFCGGVGQGWGEPEWSFVIDVDKFFSYGCTVATTKKLVKLIQSSTTPELLDTVKEYIRSQFPVQKSLMCEYRKQIDIISNNIEFEKDTIKSERKKKSGFKKNTDDWKYHSILVETHKEKLKELNENFQRVQKKLKYSERNEQFYQKVLEILP